MFGLLRGMCVGLLVMVSQVVSELVEMAAEKGAIPIFVTDWVGLYLEPSANYGLPMGLLENFYFYWLEKNVLKIRCCLALISLYCLVRRERFVAWELIFAGAISNCLDGLRYGYVRDFCTLALPGLNFACGFNLADIYITVGCTVLCYHNLFTPSYSDS